MADIKAILKIHEEGNGSINSIITSLPTNNVSTLKHSYNIINWANGLTIDNKNFAGATASPIGKLVLGDSTSGRLDVKNASNNQYVANYNGLMFGYTNSSKVFALTLTFSGSDMADLKIVFDPESNNYPTTYTLKIDGTTIPTEENASNELEITDISGNASSVQLIFNSWSQANSIVAITFIENQVIEETLTKRNINSLTTISQLTSQPQEALYGVLPNTGSLELLDYKNVLYNYANMGYLQKNSFNVDIYINDKLIQKHIVDDNPYFASSKEMSVRLSNMEKFNRTIEGSETYLAQHSVKYMITDILTRGGFTQQEIDASMTGYMVDGTSVITLANYFDSIKQRDDVYFFAFKDDSLFNMLNLVCQATRTYLYVKDNGQFSFCSARTLQSFNVNNVIDIPYKKQASTFSFDILTANKYDGVIIGKYNIAGASCDNVLDYGTNELLEKTKIRSTYMYAYLKDQILNEYKDGIRTGKIDIFPSDLYNSSGTLKKTWANGDLLEINDIVRVLDKNGEPIFEYWQVVGREVRYKGQAIVTLTLREVKKL